MKQSTKANVDLCIALVSDTPPKLPLREEVLILGVETVYNAEGVGNAAARYKAKKAAKEFKKNQNHNSIWLIPKTKEQKLKDQEKLKVIEESLESISYDEYNRKRENEHEEHTSDSSSSQSQASSNESMDEDFRVYDWCDTVCDFSLIFCNPDTKYTQFFDKAEPLQDQSYITDETASQLPRQLLPSKPKAGHRVATINLSHTDHQNIVSDSDHESISTIDHEIPRVPFSRKLPTKPQRKSKLKPKPKVVLQFPSPSPRYLQLQIPPQVTMQTHNQERGDTDRPAPCLHLGVSSHSINSELAVLSQISPHGQPISKQSDQRQCDEKSTSTRAVEPSKTPINRVHDSHQRSMQSNNDKTTVPADLCQQDDRNTNKTTIDDDDEEHFLINQDPASHQSGTIHRILSLMQNTNKATVLADLCQEDDNKTNRNSIGEVREDQFPNNQEPASHHPETVDRNLAAMQNANETTTVPVDLCQEDDSTTNKNSIDQAREDHFPINQDPNNHQPETDLSLMQNAEDALVPADSCQEDHSSVNKTTIDDDDDEDHFPINQELVSHQPETIGRNLSVTQNAEDPTVSADSCQEDDSNTNKNSIDGVREDHFLINEEPASHQSETMGRNLSLMQNATETIMSADSCQEDDSNTNKSTIDDDEEVQFPINQEHTSHQSETIDRNLSLMQSDGGTIALADSCQDRTTTCKSTIDESREDHFRIYQEPGSHQTDTIDLILSFRQTTEDALVPAHSYQDDDSNTNKTNIHKDEEDDLAIDQDLTNHQTETIDLILSLRQNAEDALLPVDSCQQFHKCTKKNNIHKDEEDHFPINQEPNSHQTETIDLILSLRQNAEDALLPVDSCQKFHSSTNKNTIDHDDTDHFPIIQEPASHQPKTVDGNLSVLQNANETIMLADSCQKNDSKTNKNSIDQAREDHFPINQEPASHQTETVDGNQTAMQNANETTTVPADSCQEDDSNTNKTTIDDDDEEHFLINQDPASHQSKTMGRKLGLGQNAEEATVPADSCQEDDSNTNKNTIGVEKYHFPINQEPASRQPETIDRNLSLMQNAEEATVPADSCQEDDSNTNKNSIDQAGEDHFPINQDPTNHQPETIDRNLSLIQNNDKATDPADSSQEEHSSVNKITIKNDEEDHLPINQELVSHQPETIDRSRSLTQNAAVHSDVILNIQRNDGETIMPADSWHENSTNQNKSTIDDEEEVQFPINQEHASHQSETIDHNLSLMQSDGGTTALADSCQDRTTTCKSTIDESREDHFRIYQEPGSHQTDTIDRNRSFIQKAGVHSDVIDIQRNDGESTAPVDSCQEDNSNTNKSTTDEVEEDDLAINQEPTKQKSEIIKHILGLMQKESVHSDVIVNLQRNDGEAIVPVESSQKVYSSRIKSTTIDGFEEDQLLVNQEPASHQPETLKCILGLMQKEGVHSDVIVNIQRNDIQRNEGESTVPADSWQEDSSKTNKSTIDEIEDDNFSINKEPLNRQPETMNLSLSLTKNAGVHSDITVKGSNVTVSLMDKIPSVDSSEFEEALETHSDEEISVSLEELNLILSHELASFCKADHQNDVLIDPCDFEDYLERSETGDASEEEEEEGEDEESTGTVNSDGNGNTEYCFPISVSVTRGSLNFGVGEAAETTTTPKEENLPPEFAEALLVAMLYTSGTVLSIIIRLMVGPSTSPRRR